ncbi:hypothetical protein ACM66B_006056 [Microbotryomycetes sp. NB124-2]
MQPAAVVPPPPPTKPARSQFIEKLHDLLEHPYDSDSMRWVSETAFEITCNDVLARRALSAKWEFRSLSSFIRQLSYYSFKRLSDRRRSGERKNGQSSFIVFTHPSGFFVRGNNSMLHGITRKTRIKSTKRRASQTSTGSAERSDESPPPPVPQAPWQPPQFSPQYGSDRRSLSSMIGSAQPQAVPSPFGPTSGVVPEQIASWRSYQPVQPGWNSGYGGHDAQDYSQRRTSLGDVRPTMPISPRDSKSLELPPAPLSSSSGVPSHMRKASSSQSLSMQGPRDEEEQQEHHHHQASYRQAEAYSTARPVAHVTYEPYPTAAVASGMTLSFGAGHVGQSDMPFPPYQHYSHAYPPRVSSGAAPYAHASGVVMSNPLPSPSYSDGGELVTSIAHAGHHVKSVPEQSHSSLVGSAAPSAKSMFATHDPTKHRSSTGGAGGYFDEPARYVMPSSSSAVAHQSRSGVVSNDLGWAPPPVKNTSSAHNYDAGMSHE